MGDVIQCSLEQDHMEGVEEHEWVGIIYCKVGNKIIFVL